MLKRIIKGMIKRHKCIHTNKITLTNIGGDAINYFNPKMVNRRSDFSNLFPCRSIKVCKDCGKYFYEGLDPNCKETNNFEEYMK